MKRTKPSRQSEDRSPDDLIQILSRANALLDLTERISHTGGWEYDLKRKTIFWTAETFRIHDMEPDELCEDNRKIKTSLECYLPEDRQTLQSAFDRCCTEGTPYDLELQMVTTKGRRIWVRTVGQPVYQNGTIGKVIGNIIDITRQKEKDEAQKQSEIKCHAILEQAAEMLFLHDMHGHIVDVNPATIAQTGYSREELLQMTVFDIDPDAEGRLDPHNVWQALEKDTQKTFEVRHRRKDGSIYPAEVRAGKVHIGSQEFILGMVRDISERRKYEEALRLREQEAKALLSAIPDLIFRLDANGTFLSFKGAREELYTDPADFIGKCIDAVLPEEVAQLTLKKIDHCLETGEIQFFEYPLTAPGQLIQTFECRMVPYSNDEVLCIIRNITERKHFIDLIESQTKSLQEKEERFRKIFENSYVGIALVKEDFRFMTANEEFCRMMSRSEKELKSLTFRELTHSEDLRNDIENLRKLKQGEVDVYTTEKRYVRPNGQFIWAKVKVSVIRSSEGAFLYFLALIDDITEKKHQEHIIRESEQKYRTLFENLHQGIFYQSADGKVTDANNATLSLFGVTRNQFLGIDSFDPRWKVINEQTEIIPPEQHPSMRALSTGQPVVNQTVGVYIPETGKYHWLIIDAIPQFRAGEDKPYQVFASMQDITKRKEAEQELFLSRQTLQEMNATKDKFFSIIAHDLRNPFNSILGFSELLQERIREEDYTEITKYATIVHRSAKGMLNLLNNLLEWSRAQSGHIEFNPTYVELAGLIREAMLLLSPTAESKKVSLHLTTERKELVFADPAMIGSVLQNLISNAIKFSHPGGEVTISVITKHQELTICVADKGIGMPPALLERLFRIDESSTRPGTEQEKGTGLGLILAQEFVAKHGGTIWAESTENQGTSIHFSLPKIVLTSDGSLRES